VLPDSNWCGPGQCAADVEDAEITTAWTNTTVTGLVGDTMPVQNTTLSLALLSQHVLATRICMMDAVLVTMLLQLPGFLDPTVSILVSNMRNHVHGGAMCPRVPSRHRSTLESLNHPLVTFITTGAQISTLVYVSKTLDTDRRSMATVCTVVRIGQDA